MGKSTAELEDLAKQHGQPTYRGKQLHDGLRQGASTFDAFSNVRGFPADDCRLCSLCSTLLRCLQSCMGPLRVCHACFSQDYG